MSNPAENNLIVVGFFGLHDNQLDGQTLKTRNIYKLCCDSGIFKNVDIFDTQRLSRSKFSLLSIFPKIARSKSLILIPARRSLRYLFPLIYVVCKIFRVEMYVFAVGGWWSDYLNNKPLHRKMLGNVKLLGVETELMKSSLIENHNLANTVLFPNFRYSSNRNFASERKSCKEKAGSSVFKMIYMGRVRPQKGVCELFSLAERLENEGIKASIDIYGPIGDPFNENFKSEFLSRVDGCDNISYKGTCDSEKVVHVISEYDLFLFPTKYYTEGLPGAIIDASIAGVPVISARWQSYKQFVHDDVNGLTFEIGDTEGLVDKVFSVVTDNGKLSELKKGASKFSYFYSKEYAMSHLKAFFTTP